MTFTIRDDSFIWLVNCILPIEGYTFVFEAYFDESGTHDGAHVLCVAGYIIEKNESIKLTKEWNKVLAKYNLPYFRMVACAHGNDVFKNIDKEERVEIGKKLIKIIKRRTICGLAVSVNTSDLVGIIPKHKVVSSAYAFSIECILAGVHKWIEANPQVQKMAYFFESGCSEQYNANMIIHALFSLQEAQQKHRYTAHTFLEKKEAAPLQAADLFSWQYYSDMREGKKRRRDFESLLEHPHYIEHLDKNKLIAIKEKFEKIPNWGKYYLSEGKQQ